MGCSTGPDGHKLTPMYLTQPAIRPILRAAAGVLICVVVLAAQTSLPPGHPDDYPQADIEYGASLYGLHCEECHAENGTGVAGVDLRSGVFKNATSDRDLRRVISNGFPTAGMPPMDFSAGEMAGLIAFLRNMNAFDAGSLEPGDPKRGQLVFEGKGGCLSCHRVGDKGSRKAPDLSDIGAVASAGRLERNLLTPNTQMFPINRPVRAVTKDGKVITGRRLNEDTYTVQLADEEGRLVSVAKDDLREFTISTESTMPSYQDKLTEADLSDLVAYLLSLKGI